MYRSQNTTDKSTMKKRRTKNDPKEKNVSGCGSIGSLYHVIYMIY